MAYDISNLPKPVDLAYRCYEPENGVEHQTPCICLHGLFTCMAHWKDLPKRLADQSKRIVFCCDIREHGESPYTTDFSFPAMVSDVVHFMNAHNIEKAICIGHSLGGMIFSRVATLFPHLVEKLILLDINAYPEFNKTKAKLEKGHELFIKIREIARAENLEFEAAVERANEIMKPILPERKRKSILKRLVNRDGRLDWNFNLDQLNLVFLKDKFEEIRPKSDVETLEIYGGKSDLFDQTDLETIREFLPNIKIEKIEEADHELQLAYPNEFLSIVIPFMNG